MSKEIRYIAIEGVLGAGKSSLAKMLAAKLNARLIEEEFRDNPFLEKFYSNPQRYAFQTQMFFLINRFKQQQFLNQEDLFTEFIVSDYYFEKDRIFAFLNLNPEEMKLYDSVYPLLKKELRKPDLVIYLQSSTDRILFNIKKRGRKTEREITRNYIRELSEAYNDFFFKFNDTPLLIVNSTEIDFVSRHSDFEELCEQIFREDRGFIEYFNPGTRG